MPLSNPFLSFFSQPADDELEGVDSSQPMNEDSQEGSHHSHRLRNLRGGDVSQSMSMSMGSESQGMDALDFSTPADAADHGWEGIRGNGFGDGAPATAGRGLGGGRGSNGAGGRGGGGGARGDKSSINSGRGTVTRGREHNYPPNRSPSPLPKKKSRRFIADSQSQCTQGTQGDSES